MSGFIKDLAVLLFSGGDEILKKSIEFKNQREERYRLYDEMSSAKRDQGKTDSRTSAGKTMDEDLDKMKDYFHKISSQLGFASRKEVDELKSLIKKLKSKIEEMEKNEKY